MNLYFTLASYLVAASMGFGAAWKWQAANITEMQLEQAHETLTLEQDARDETERRIAQVTAAQNNATARLRVVADDRGRADLIGDGLRLTTAETVRAAGENTAACAERINTLGIVFDQCAERLIEVAEAADRWHSEAVKQNEAAQ